jgi:hypothetical protein
MGSTWSDEILVPNPNLIAYRQIYEAETWLRRIALASFMLKVGPAWATSLDLPLRVQLEEESARNAGRWYLGVDAEEELLWSTTQHQLATLLEKTDISGTVNHLCRITGRLLARRLSSIKDIRNTLAHNRAISDDTMTVLNGDLQVVNAAVNVFKRSVLYAESDLYLDGVGPDGLEALAAEFHRKEQTFRDQQLVFTANADFVFLVWLPVKPFDLWPDARSMKRSFGFTSRLILCVMANKQGNELQVVFPRSLSDADQLEVLGKFMSHPVLVQGWTRTPPEDQHSADVSWPRLWFYENRPPE